MAELYCVPFHTRDFDGEAVEEHQKQARHHNHGAPGRVKAGGRGRNHDERK
jgi:hypothetical protein